MTGDTCGAGGAHSSGTPGLTLAIAGVHVFSQFFTYRFRSAPSIAILDHLLVFRHDFLQQWLQRHQFS